MSNLNPAAAVAPCLYCGLIDCCHRRLGAFKPCGHCGGNFLELPRAWPGHGAVCEVCDRALAQVGMAEDKADESAALRAAFEAMHDRAAYPADRLAGVIRGIAKRSLTQ